MKGFAAVVEPVPARCGVHSHSADGVAHARDASDVMTMMAVAKVIVAGAAGGALRGARIHVIGNGHQSLHPRLSCNPYPVGVYWVHEKRDQGILSKTPEPDRGPGPRPGQNGRRGPLLHRYSHADLGGARRAPPRRGRSAEGSRLPLRRTRDRKRKQVRSAPENIGADGRHWSIRPVVWARRSTRMSAPQFRVKRYRYPANVMVGAVPNGSLRVVDVAETRQTTISREKHRVRRRQQISCKPQFAGIARPRPATRGGKLSNPIAEREKRNATPAP